MFIELIRQKKYDVMLVQETHNDVQNESDWKMEWDGEVILSHNSSCSGGVAHFKPLSYEVEDIVKGQFLKVRANFEKFILVFVNVYAPVLARERVCFYKEIE